MRYFWILTLLTLCMPLASSAQIDVEDYRQSVVEYSYTLKKSSVTIDYAIEAYETKRSDFLPSLTLSGDFVQQFRNSEGQESWSFYLQPQIAQTLYSGGSVRAESKKAALGVDIAELDAQYNLLDVCYTADYYYYSLSAMKSYLYAVDQYVKIIQSLQEVVLLRYNEGYISKGDLLMIETRLSEALYQQIAIGEDYTIALQKFNILRGYNAEEEVQQIPVDIPSVELPKRVTLEELLALRPDFLASQLTADQAGYTVEVTRAAYNPTLSIGVAGSWQPQMPNVNGSTIMDGSLFVKLSASLFHFGERRRAMNASRALHENYKLSTLALIDDIRLEESNMWATIIDSRAQLEAAKRALIIGSENLEISTFAYSEGLTTILDVMQAQISWLQLYGNSIWSEFNFLVSISAYRRITATQDL
ncbi:MAG: TolC family protein [Rikenellaceae bacterium]